MGTVHCSCLEGPCSGLRARGARQLAMRRPGARLTPASEPIFSLTAPPPSAAAAGQPVARRQWNPTPPELLPQTPGDADKHSTAHPSRPKSGKQRAEPGAGRSPTDKEDVASRRRPGSAGLSASTKRTTLPASNEPAGDQPRSRKLSVPSRPVTVSEDSSTEQRSRQTRPPPASSPIVKRQHQLEVHERQLHKEGRRDPLKSTVVLRSLRVQDVEPDAVRPLIEIAYWSPFVEVRRDAAAALASLSRNSTYPLRLPG